MRFVCLSDTHTMGRKVGVPDGDVLLHAGDLTLRGTESETLAALEWLESLPHKHKVLVAGNHDFFFDNDAPAIFRDWRVRPFNFTPGDMQKRKEATLARYPGLTYLEDESTTIDGLKIYGSPWQPWFWDWAFNFPERDDGNAARALWRHIPDDTDILLTHTPPLGILDRNLFDGRDNHRIGDQALAERLQDLPGLRAHVFGHFHGGYGQETRGGTLFVNACICTEEYRPTNAPIVFDLNR